MKEAIENRELIVLDGLDVITRGTYHKTFDGSGIQSKLIKRGHIGVLFLNSPSPTRAAQGDSAVYWADSFAERGYPSFRLDLPGFGDSEGSFPADGLDSVSSDSSGGYAPIAVAKIRELVARFNLEGVVIVEQCSTSISTLYAAACCLECKGLVLMDPCFDLPQATKSTDLSYPNERSLQWCRRLSRTNCDSPRRLQSFMASSENTDDVIHRPFKNSASIELPVLIFKTHSREPIIGELDYLKYIIGLAGRNCQVAMNMLDSASRSFTSRVGRLIIRQRTEQWLDSNFPLATHTEDPLNVSYPKRMNDKHH